MCSSDLEHLARTQRFYDRYGAKTVFFARFVPIVRTFAPFVAGIGHMRYPRFLFFSFTGSIAWVGSLAYAAVSQRFAPRLAGRVNTVLNLFVFLGAFIAQWGIGAIVNLWPQPEAGHFAHDGYTAAFTTIWFWRRWDWRGCALRAPSNYPRRVI